MARTYRRTNRHGLSSAWWWYRVYVLDRDSPSIEYLMWRFNLSKKDATIKARYQFHSDRDAGWNAPASYRKMFTKEFRAKNKAILRNALIKSVDDTPDFEPFKHTVNWHYF